MSGPFEAFLKSAQYLARVRSRQDVLEQAGRLITNHFPAEWVAFGERQGQEELSIHSCTSSNPQVAQLLAGKELCAIAGDVLGTGFLAMRVVSTSSPMITAVFPLTEGDQTEAVMVVGQPGLEPISAEFLNVYLALAGLVGTTLDRLRNEEELVLHRMYLEDLVDERTRELEEAKNRNELILQSVGEGICGLDVDGNITFANPYAAYTLGWDQDDLLGRDAHETFHRRHADGSPYLSEECSVRAHITGRRTGLVGDEAFCRRDGSLFPVEFSTAPISQDGEMLGAVLVFRDITTRKEAEEERERLLAKEQELGEELATINEELQAQNEELAEQQEELEAQNQELQAAHAESDRLLEEQRDMFHRLQQALLDIPTQLPGVGFGHLYRSATTEAQIGGDFYDVFQTKDGRIGLLIGDVSGHGIETARVATLVKDSVRAFSLRLRRPHRVLQETNELLTRRLPQGFVTAFLGFLDLNAGTFVYSSAGHLPPLLKFGDHVEALQSVALPLGVFADAPYRDKQTQVPPGAILLFYTDGLTEARRGAHFFGEDGARDALLRFGDLPVDKLPSALLEQALVFCGGCIIDDVAVLAVSYQGLPESGGTLGGNG